MSRHAKILVTALIAAGLLAFSGSPTEAAVDSIDEYRPCESGQGIDLLLMMDESGSLNLTADPGGVQRTLALELIRDYLKGEPDIRIALIGFDTEAKLHMPNFGQASNQHPSGQIIEESLGQMGDTNYTVALEAALDAFETISGGANFDDRCRVLVFFTDGIYDPIDGRNVSGAFGSEEDFADRLIDQTCSPSFGDGPGFKTQLDDMGIQTYAVLLGDAFQTGVQSTDGHERRMATASMQVIRAITGHGSSPLVADVANDPLCRPWSDDQTGEIITVANIEDFANKLLEVVRASTQLLKWPDCDNEVDGRRIRSAQLPAGVYINEILIFAYGGTIEGYEILDGNGVPIGLPGQPPAQSPLQFDHRHLKGLEAGWTLQLLVTSPPGETVTLSCYGDRVPTPLEFGGLIVDRDDRPVDKLLDTEDYSLHVVLGDYVCPIDGGFFSLSAVSAPGSPTLSNRPCSPGERIVEFDYQPSRPLEESESVRDFDGFVEPMFAANLFPAAEAQFSALVSVGFEVLVASENAPQLDCDGPSTVNDVSGGFPGNIVAVQGCRVIPPKDGTATIEIDWDSDDAPDLGWSPAGPIELEPGSDEKNFVVESDELPTDGMPTISGTVEITVEWVPSDGSTQPPIEESITVEIDRLDDSLIGGSATFLTCSANQVTIANTDVKVPRQPIEGSAGCVLEPPPWGAVTVVASWIPPSDVDVPGPIDWQFDENLSKEVTLEAGDPRVELDFVTTDGLDNRRWDLTGDIHLVATWDPLIKDNLPAGDITLPVTLDFQAHDRLSCSEDQLTITNADVEVPRDTAVKGTAGCVLEPPWEGSITVVASWIPPSDVDVPGPIDWQFDENLSKEVTLEAGDPRVELDFVTTDELDNRRWDLTGEIHLVWVSNNGEELPLEDHILTVPLSLRGRSNSVLAFWLAILIAIASVLITYGGLYRLLVYSNRLPSPEKFWVLEKDLAVGRGPTGRLHAPDLDRFRPSGDDLNPVTGDRQKRKWLKAGQLRINAAHASFWNLPGLLAGGWGQAERAGRLFNATPPGRYPGTTRVLFDRLTVVAVNVESQSASPAATIYFLVPRSGPLSGTEAVEAQIPEAKTLIDDLTERYEQDTTARDLDHHDDDDSLSPPPPPGPSGPPPPPRPGSSGPPPPPGSSGPPPPPGSSGPPPPPGSSGPPPPPRPGSSGPPPPPGSSGPPPPPRPGSSGPPPPPPPG